MAGEGACRIPYQVCIAVFLALVAGSFWRANYILVPLLALAVRRERKRGGGSGRV